MELAFQCKRLRRRLIQSKINHSIYLLGQYVWNIKKFCNKTNRQTNNMKNRDSWCASEKVYISNGQLHNDDSFSVNITYCVILKCLMNIYTVLKIKWDNRQSSGLQLCIPPAVLYTVERTEIVHRCKRVKLSHCVSSKVLIWTKR